MSYALWLKNPGEGCDYTIGCGEKLVRMGDTRPTVDEISTYIEDNYGDERDYFKNVMIIKIVHDFSSDEIDLLFPEEDEEDDEEDAEVAERRRAYEELKKEFG